MLIGLTSQFESFVTALDALKDNKILFTQLHVKSRLFLREQLEKI